jgi:thiamine-phosphate pyrophosphorylase
VNLPALTAIVDADVTAACGWTVPDAARACLDGGARFLQVRAKRVPSGAFLDWCDVVVAAAVPYGAAVVVNDRADIARMAGASGVHVGQDDLPASAARALLGASAIVGLSTHTREQIVAARSEPLTYLAVGPIFGSRTKETGYDPVGLDLVQFAAAAADGAVPVVAIGGITLDGAPQVMAAGAASVAVIGDLFATGNPEARTRQFLARLGDVAPRV